MLEDAIAESHYGDISGTISIDGFDGLQIRDMFEGPIPKGYWPIGIRLHGSNKQLKNGRGGKPSIEASILCVDTEQTGKSATEIRDFGKKNGRLPTFEFDVEIDLTMLLTRIKIYDIVLLSRIVDEIPVKVQTRDD